LVSFAVILVVVPAKAPSHNSVSFVFTNFINNTGWKQDGIAFIVGLVNTNWSFTCLDCATHLAEEVPRPERMVPVAICGTVAIGFVTSWFFALSMMFSIQDLEAAALTPTYVPILEIFNQAINTTGACVLEAMIILTAFGCLIAAHTWQSRLCWSFARDGGLPGHKWLARVNHNLDAPLFAHATSTTLTGLVGLLYLGSSAAFFSYVHPASLPTSKPGTDRWQSGRRGYRSSIHLLFDPGGLLAH